MKRNGFTLIELLIVVGIIGILAAIAVPNYRDATVKSKVVRAQMDLRAIGTALESYRLDNAMYPRKHSDLLFFVQYIIPDLTTPIPYLTTGIRRDPFGPVKEYEAPLGVDDQGPERFVPELIKNSYTYTPYMNFARIHGNPAYRKEGFAVSSVGPDQQDSFVVDYPFPNEYRYPGDTVRDSVYNPSNGIISPGDIGYFGGDLPVSGLIGG